MINHAITGYACLFTCRILRHDLLQAFRFISKKFRRGDASASTVVIQLATISSVRLWCDFFFLFEEINLLTFVLSVLIVTAIDIAQSGWIGLTSILLAFVSIYDYRLSYQREKVTRSTRISLDINTAGVLLFETRMNSSQTSSRRSLKKC